MSVEYALTGNFDGGGGTPTNFSFNVIYAKREGDYIEFEAIAKTKYWARIYRLLETCRHAKIRIGSVIYNGIIEEFTVETYQDELGISIKMKIEEVSVHERVGKLVRSGEAKDRSK